MAKKQERPPTDTTAHRSMPEGWEQCRHDSIAALRCVDSDRYEARATTMSYVVATAPTAKEALRLSAEAAERIEHVISGAVLHHADVAEYSAAMPWIEKDMAALADTLERSGVDEEFHGSREDLLADIVGQIRRGAWR